MRDKSFLNQYGFLLGPLLFGIAFAVYLITLAPGAYPGESAELIVFQTDAGPFLSFLQPLWGEIARLLAAIPIGRLSIRLNVFSALCAAASVWMLFVLVSRIKHDRTTEEMRAHFSHSAARYFSGLVAALMLAFSLPFWTVATRAHFHPFDLALFLLYLLLWSRYRTTRDMRWLTASAVLYGIGMVQSAIFIIVFPVMLAVLMVDVLLNRQWSFRLFFWALGGLALGGSFILLAAWRFYLSPSYAWRETSGFFYLLWAMLRDQGRQVTSGVGQMGWMLVLLTIVLPWVVVLLVPRRGSEGRSGVVGSVLLHAVITIISWVLLFNLAMSPWAVMGSASLLVTPSYVLAAAWTGYLAGYWFALFSRRSPVQWIWVGVVLLGLGYAAVRNYAEADGRTGLPTMRMAEEIVDALGDRDWLVSGGGLDANIQVAAWERGKRLVMLNPRLGRNPPYLRYLSTLFEDQRMKGLAQLGLSPLLSEWMQYDPEIGAKLAVMSAPELWESVGYRPVPNGVVYVGVQEEDALDADALMASHRAVWARFHTLLSTQDGPSTDRWLRGHVGRLANNLGVLFEEQGESAYAEEAYLAARSFETNNVSALLNLMGLMAREGRPEAETYQKELDAFLNRSGQRINLWALSHNYGYVRHPEAYVRQGMAWAMTGRANVGRADIQRAIEMGGDSPSLQLVMAYLYRADQDLNKSEAIYRSLLEKDPDHIPSIRGLAQLAVLRGALDEARGYYNRLAELGVPASDLVVELAIVDAMAGDTAEVKKRLLKHVESYTGDARAWAVLVLMGLELDDGKLIDDALNALSQVGQTDQTMLMVVAHAQLLRDRPEAARETLMRVLSMRRDHIGALEQLLWLDVSQGRQDLAERHVEMLLTVDPRNALGNYILGSIQVANHDLAVAEASFRRSVKSRATPDALNDLAWLLSLRGEHKEALSLIRQAVALNDASPTLWDTLAVVLMRMDQHAEAKATFLKALALRPDDPQITIHLAELHEKMGQYEEGRKLLQPLLDNAATLPSALYRDAQDLMTRLQKR